MSRANPRFRRVNPLLPAVANNVYRVRVLGTLEGQLTISTFYYRDELATATATNATQSALMTALQAAGALVPSYAAACSNDWGLSRILIDCPTSPSLSTADSGALTLNGSVAGGHEPTPLAAVIARVCAVKGQCGRGHVSIPAVPTTFVTLSSLTNLAAHNALAVQARTVLNGGGHTYTPCIFSRGNRTTRQFGHSDITATQVRAVLGTVRRRKLGRGK